VRKMRNVRTPWGGFFFDSHCISCQFCSMGVRPSPRPWANVSMPSTPGVCVKFLRIRYTRHTTNETVRSITCCSPVSERVKCSPLKFFGHLTRSAEEEDHVVSAALRPPSDWRRPLGRPRNTWLRTIDDDVQPLNFGDHKAWRKARDREVWQQVVSTATLC